MTVQHILLKSIRPDPKWKYRLEREDPILVKSLKLTGILSPLVLLQDKSGFVILDGFKRYRFLSDTGCDENDNTDIKLPAFLYSIGEAKEGFLHSLVLNETRRSLSTVEKSNVVKIIQSFKEDEDFQHQVYDFLDIPAKRPFIQKYVNINSFPDEAKQYLHETQFSLRQIERIMPVSTQALLPWIQLAQELNIKAQEFVNLVEIIWDISIKKNIAVDALYQKLNIEEIRNRSLTKQQKVAYLKSFLHEKRYPMLNHVQKKVIEQIDRIREKSKLPLRISWDQALEQSGYQLMIYLENENSINQLQAFLESPELMNNLRELFPILINSLENLDETT